MAAPPDPAEERLPPNPTLSDVARQHAREVKMTKLIREQLIGLQDWVQRMVSGGAGSSPGAPASGP